ncbi:hypothetical protein Scep_011211 [Stephania cephalantha]|uniref:Uncharacterized protein n=1 Tax=Stephania cephalantha TaxID=152367 RepID=A0AAP0JCW9_9MAGN
MDFMVMGQWRQGGRDGGWEGSREVGTVEAREARDGGRRGKGPPEGGEDAAGSEDGRGRSGTTAERLAGTVERGQAINERHPREDGGGRTLARDATREARTPGRESEDAGGRSDREISVRARGDGEEKQTNGTRVLGGLKWLGSRDPGHDFLMSEIVTLGHDFCLHLQMSK